MINLKQQGLRARRGIGAAVGTAPVALAGAALALLAGCATPGPKAPALPATDFSEHAQTVPGFADFIALDGASAWVTNRGRVEQWSRSGKLAEVPIAHPCGAMSVAFGALWVADCTNRALDRIDLKTHRIDAVIPTGLANPRGETNVVAGAGSIWVASDAQGQIARVDPATNRVTARIPVSRDAYYLSFGLGALWATSPTQRSLEKVDPAANRVVAKVGLGRDPGFLVAGAGGVWVQEQGDGTVARIDPQTTTVTARLKIGDTLKYGDIDAGGGKIWLRTTNAQTFVVIDPAHDTVEARVGPPNGSGALRYANGGLWTTSHDIHTLSWWSIH